MNHRSPLGSSASRIVPALVVLMTMASLSYAGSFPQTRQGWLVGFSAGGGSAGISSGGESSDREGGAAGSFRVGYAFNPDLSLEYNSNAWAKSKDGVTIAYSTNTAALNFYPGHNGFVLRGGVGFGSGQLATKVNNSTLTTSESGFGFNLGAAYEFRVTRTFAIGPQVDYGWTTLSDFDANWVTVGLGFNWYFIPK